MRASLQRLQLNYIDIVIIHKADPMCPMEGGYSDPKGRGRFCLPAVWICFRTCSSLSIYIISITYTFSFYTVYSYLTLISLISVCMNIVFSAIMIAKDTKFGRLIPVNYPHINIIIIS